jgi:hypothetical protein
MQTYESLESNRFKEKSWNRKEIEEKINYYQKRINEINAKLESGVNL